MTEKGSATLMPDVRENSLKILEKYKIKLGSPTQTKTLLKKLQSSSLNTQKKLVAAFSNWENNLFSPFQKISYETAEDITEKGIAATLIFLHYETNQAFIPDKYILKNINKIGNLPTVIVHGRYDILCPLLKAHQLNSKLSNCQLFIADSSGHSFTAEGETIRDMAFDRFLDKNA